MRWIGKTAHWNQENYIITSVWCRNAHPAHINAEQDTLDAKGKLGSGSTDASYGQIIRAHIKWWYSIENKC